MTMAVETLILATYLALGRCLGFAFDAIPPPPRIVFQPTRALRLDGERVRGTYRRGRATVALDAANQSSTAHELGHHLLWHRDGDADGEHENHRAWACVDEAIAAPAFGDVAAVPFYGEGR